jgi:hypothetical protein
LDHLVRGQELSSSHFLNSQVILQSNLHLFPEVRLNSTASELAFAAVAGSGGSKFA